MKFIIPKFRSKIWSWNHRLTKKNIKWNVKHDIKICKFIVLPLLIILFAGKSLEKECRNWLTTISIFRQKKTVISIIKFQKPFWTLDKNFTLQKIGGCNPQCPLVPPGLNTQLFNLLEPKTTSSTYLLIDLYRLNDQISIFFLINRIRRAFLNIWKAFRLAAKINHYESLTKKIGHVIKNWWHQQKNQNFFDFKIFVFTSYEGSQKYSFISNVFLELLRHNQSQAKKPSGIELTFESLYRNWKKYQWKALIKCFHLFQLHFYTVT